jgi:hypothetical protein
MLGFQRAIVVRHSSLRTRVRIGVDLQGRVVAVTPDNRRAVSASADETLGVGAWRPAAHGGPSKATLARSTPWR